MSEKPPESYFRSMTVTNCRALYDYHVAYVKHDQYELHLMDSEFFKWLVIGIVASAAFALVAMALENHERTKKFEICMRTVSNIEKCDSIQ